MRLYAWTRADERGASALVGEIEVAEGAPRLVSCRDPELAAAMRALQQEDHLPLTIREIVKGNRHVRCERLRPGDADYWRALAEHLTRRTGHAVTESDHPPK